MKKQIQLVAVLICFFLFPGWGWCGSYKIATVGWVGWAPLHVAEVKGFWKKQGVSIDVVNYDDPIIILEAIKAGKIDLAMDMAGSVVGIFMSGEPVVAVAETNWSHGGDKIIVHKGHGIAEYKTQPLGVFLKLPSCLYFLNMYLETQQLGIDDFRIVEIHPDDLAEQFVSGRIPVILNYEPWASKAVEAGDGFVLASSSDYAGCIPECIWGYRERIEKIPDKDIKKILSGWIKAAQWVQNPANRKGYFEILNEVTFKGHSDYTETKLQQMIEKVKIHSAKDLMARNRTNGGLYQYLAALKAFLKKYDLLERDYEISEIFENRWIMGVLTAEYPVDPAE